MVEPKYPGAVEEYVNLGRAYQREGLQEVKGELMSCMTGYKACYQRAYRCLGAAAAIQEDLRATLTTPALEERLAKRAKGILSRELKARPVLPGQVRVNIRMVPSGRRQSAGSRMRLPSSAERMGPFSHVSPSSWER